MGPPVAELFHHEKLHIFQSSDGFNPPPTAIDTKAHRGLLPQAVEHTAGFAHTYHMSITDGDHQEPSSSTMKKEHIGDCSYLWEPPGAQLSHHEKLDTLETTGLVTIDAPTLWGYGREPCSRAVEHPPGFS